MYILRSLSRSWSIPLQGLAEESDQTASSPSSSLKSSSSFSVGDICMGEREAEEEEAEAVGAPEVAPKATNAI